MGLRLPGALTHFVSGVAETSTLCFALRHTPCIFTAVGRGATTQNRESRGGRAVPDGALLFCPNRNFSFP